MLMNRGGIFPTLVPFAGARVVVVLRDLGEMLEVALPVRPNDTTGRVL